MTSLIKFLVTVPFVAILIWLSFANQDSVTLTWSPLHAPSEVPVAVIILGAVVAGFIWGALIAWLNEARTRRLHRQNRRAVSKLETQLEHEKTKQVSSSLPHTPPPAGPPLLT